MKIIKISRRRILLLILACGFVSFGILVGYECLHPGMDKADIKKIGAFYAYRMQSRPKGVPSPEVGAMQLLALDSDVGKFRSGAVMVSDMKAVAGLSEVTPGAFQNFFNGKISAKFPYIWPYVIAGSFTVMGNTQGDEPVVAFYNPYFDVAILTRWKFHAGPAAEPGYKLIEAVPVTGRAFLENRASLSTDQPVWADSKSSIFEVGIVKAAHDFIAAFEKRYPPFGRDPAAALSVEAGSAGAAVALVEERVFSLLGWVIDAQNPAAKVNYAAGIKQLQNALSATSPRKLETLLPQDNPQRANLFFNLEHGIREGMKPYLVVNRNVIFINPVDLPTAFLSVYFEPSAAGYRPGLVALFNLEANSPGK